MHLPCFLTALRRAEAAFALTKDDTSNCVIRASSQRSKLTDLPEIRTLLDPSPSLQLL